MQNEKARQGHVYVLTSSNCKYVKIGGTDYPPLKRIKEINSREPYKQHGLWTLHDFRQVVNWPAVESSLHYTFRSKLAKSIKGQRELFKISPVEASEILSALDESQVIKKPKVDRLFQDQDFSYFLAKLFRSTTILNWLDLQGAWTLSLFPSTRGGRYYTLNIGTHEVGYTTLEKYGYLPRHMIYMDILIKDFQEVKVWLKNHSGGFKKNVYSSSLDHSTSVYFDGSFDTAIEFLGLPGVRRAIIAYWTEALVELQERAALSVNSQHHNWNAVAELKSRMDAGRI